MKNIGTANGTTFNDDLAFEALTKFPVGVAPDVCLMNRRTLEQRKRPPWLHWTMRWEIAEAVGYAIYHSGIGDFRDFETRQTGTRVAEAEAARGTAG